MNDFEYCKEIGEQYQDFITDKLWELGISLNCYSSKKYQMSKGENRVGIEIKHDSKMATTQNLFIEFQAINKNENQMIKGGITKQDLSWLYLIGDEKEAFIFSKQQLNVLLEKVSANELAWKNKYGITLRPHIDSDTNIITSRGLVIPIESAKRMGLIIKHLVFDTYIDLPL